jgi:hypothetical protein
MSEELKRYFRGRTGAWVGLILYVIGDICLEVRTFLSQAPDDLATVNFKTWLELFFGLVAGAIMMTRSYVSGAWGDAKDGVANRAIYAASKAPTTPTAQKGET